ncbi:hypothetical protein FB106_1052 [Synechococcus sp. Ace-Pa]|nr:hypothetical protein FB106_1052 [Synechococcus sp. Ace-Pa]
MRWLLLQGDDEVVDALSNPSCEKEALGKAIIVR